MEKAVVKWASCGAKGPDIKGGQIVNRDPVVPPPNPPAGLQTMELKAGDFSVAQNATDHYRCFPYDVKLEKDLFIKRFEMALDQTKVLHHIVLFRDTKKAGSVTDYDCPSGMPSGSNYMFAWAPSPAGGFEFPEGGTRIRNGDRLVLQIHYNNSAQVPDVRDASGVRLYLTEPQGKEWGMIAIGPKIFAIMPRSKAEAASNCRVTQATEVFSGAPHMHKLGKDFVQVLTRKDGSSESFIELHNWRFDNELFYRIPLTINPGDTLRTTCTFENPTDKFVTFGPRTQDEMCFDFTYLSPPPADEYCDAP